MLFDYKVIGLYKNWMNGVLICVQSNMTDFTWKINGGGRGNWIGLDWINP